MRGGGCWGRLLRGLRRREKWKGEGRPYGAGRKSCGGVGDDREKKERRKGKQTGRKWKRKREGGGQSQGEKGEVEGRLGALTVQRGRVWRTSKGHGSEVV